MIFHSSFEYCYLWLPLIGFFTGLIATMTGGGGGFVILPVLILLFKVPAQIAVTTSLAATLPVCIVGSVGHYRNGNTDIRTGLVFVFAGIIGALCGAGLTKLMNSRQLKICFGIYSILIALLMIFNNWKKKIAEIRGSTTSGESQWQKTARSSFFGLFAGVITGTFGTSGTAPVLAGLLTMRMPVKIVIGTSLLVVCANTISALGAHFLVGEIDLTLVYFLIAGAITGAVIGPRLLAGANIDIAERPIRLWYALGMTIFGILMIIIK